MGSQANRRSPDETRTSKGPPAEVGPGPQGPASQGPAAETVGLKVHTRNCEHVQSVVAGIHTGGRNVRNRSSDYTGSAEGNAAQVVSTAKTGSVSTASPTEGIAATKNTGSQARPAEVASTS